MLTEEKNPLSASAYYLLIKSSIPRISLCYEEIMSAQALIEYMGFMINAKENII